MPGTSTFFRLAALALPALLVKAKDRPYELEMVNTVLAPDGFKRQVAVVNGQFPGPILTANRGDTFMNNVINKLDNPDIRRSTSIHWHGFFQARSAHQDGPSSLNQCPIAPGTTYMYDFSLADQEGGTFWYHSHLSTQYVDGIRGSIVVYDPNDPHKALYDVDDLTTVVQLSDWYHELAPKLTDQFLQSGSIPCPDSALINGAGRYKGGPKVPYNVMSVKAGKRYRYRIININSLGYYTFEIDSHTFTIIEADGVSHEAIPNIKSIDIHVGQRYSVILTADQNPDNYWIRAPIIPNCSNKNLDPDLTLAILRYEGAKSVEPTSKKSSGKKFDASALHPLINPGAPGGSAPADVVIDLKYGTNSKGPWKAAWMVNDETYEPPSVPTLLRILSHNGNTIGNDDFAKTENTIVLPRDKVIQLNIHGSSQGFKHPWHLHGHAFDVITDGDIPENYKNPGRRDVVAVGGGMAKIRFKSDNPGPWFLHCHIDWHLEAGLAVIFAERPDEQRPGPNNPYSVKTSPAWDKLCEKYDALPKDQQ